MKGLCAFTVGMAWVVGVVGGGRGGGARAFTNRLGPI